MRKFFLVVSLIALLNVPVWAKSVTVGPKEASVLFRIQHNDGYTLGYFTDFNATVELDDSGKVLSANSTVETNSVYSKNIVRDERLRSDMFFDSAKFPQASFTSTGVEGATLNGTLTIRGISKPVSFSIEQDRDKLRLNGSFDRNDFGMTFNEPWGKNKKAIGDKVDLIVELKTK